MPDSEAGDLEPLDEAWVCDDDRLDRLAALLWNDWFDRGADPDDHDPGLLLHAREVLHEDHYSDGSTAWSLEEGIILLRSWDDQNVAAFEFLPNQHDGDYIGVGVAVDPATSEVIVVDLHEGNNGIPPVGMERFDELTAVAAVELFVTDDGTGHLNLTC